MGMYTELHFNAELKQETPQRVLDTLAAMTRAQSGSFDPPDDHPLFRTSRWRMMLLSDSYYFAGDTSSTLNYDTANFWTLSVRCNLKNYDDEIGHFIDWIMPWVETEGLLGFYRYEEDADPTLIYARSPQ